VKTLPAWRTGLYRVGVSILAVQAIFYAIWQRVGQHLNPCRGKAAGVLVGFLIAAMTPALLLFGSGWKRWVPFVIALLLFYLWFSWIAWIGQMQC
jgi:hypothetical protein